MGVKERREREREAMRERILATVRKIARSEGWGAVTIRRVADDIEYSSPILYQYFDNKDAIVARVREDGFAELHRRMAAVPSTLPAPDRLVALARANVELGLTEPEVYQAMFGLGGAQIDNCRYPLPPTATRELVRDTMCAVITEAGQRPDDVEDEVTIMGAALHGLVSLCLNGLSDVDDFRVLDLAERTARDFVRRRGVE